MPRISMAGIVVAEWSSLYWLGLVRRCRAIPRLGLGVRGNKSGADSCLYVANPGSSKRQMIGIAGTGGEGGIRTPGRGVSPYNGLANRRLQPLGHLSGDFQQFNMAVGASAELDPERPAA